MGAYVASETIKLMVKKEIPIKNARILILGFAFKENCPDICNTRVIDIVNELKSYQANVFVWDPWAEPATAQHEYGIETFRNLDGNAAKYDAVILAVAHDEFRGINIRDLVNSRSVVYDVKGILNTDICDARL
jgi:UDP-N-acetyl-D-galactosamine dehydrogenase